MTVPTPSTAAIASTGPRRWRRGRPGPARASAPEGPRWRMLRPTSRLASGRSWPPRCRPAGWRPHRRPGRRRPSAVDLSSCGILARSSATSASAQVRQCGRLAAEVHVLGEHDLVPAWPWGRWVRSRALVDRRTRPTGMISAEAGQAVPVDRVDVRPRRPCTPRSRNRRMRWDPKPSMSMEPRPAKCSSAPARWKGHSPSWQRVSLSPSGRTRTDRPAGRAGPGELPHGGGPRARPGPRRRAPRAPPPRG